MENYVKGFINKRGKGSGKESKYILEYLERGGAEWRPKDMSKWKINREICVRSSGSLIIL